MRRILVLASILVACLFLSQGCTLVMGRAQKIPLTSDRMGASVTVDGAATGSTPLVLRLRRDADHVVRVVQEGFNPVEIVIKHRPIKGLLAADAVFSVLILPGVGAGVGYLVAPADMLGHKRFPAAVPVGAVAGLVLGIVNLMVDSSSGVDNKLAPSRLDVTLTPVGGSPVAQVFYLTSEQVAAIRWIRVLISNN